MKLAVDKGRLALVLLALAAALAIGALIRLYLLSQNEVTLLQVKLHAVPARPVAMQTVTPSATPTAALKYYPTKGLVK